MLSQISTSPTSHEWKYVKAGDVAWTRSIVSSALPAWADSRPTTCIVEAEAEDEGEAEAEG